MVTGTFLINNHYASILFDTGADFSFVSNEFKQLLGLEANKLDTHFSTKLANGKVIESTEVVKDCKLELCDHEFSIDLLPIDLGSFDIVVGMDWLSKNHATIVCDEKLLRIPL